MTKRRVIQRRVVVVLLLLLAGGAIVNVAVAWGCLYVIEPRFNEKAPRKDPQWYDCGAIRTSKLLNHIRAQELRNFNLFVPWKESLTHVGPPAQWYYDDFSGFPLLSMHTGGTNIQTAMAPRNMANVNLPLLVLWPGFAINTIFYAAILWVVFAFPFVLRRRRRIKRGLCPACAYPVGTSDICTECGRQLR